MLYLLQRAMFWIGANSFKLRLNCARGHGDKHKHQKSIIGKGTAVSSAMNENYSSYRDRVIEVFSLNNHDNVPQWTLRCENIPTLLNNLSISQVDVNHVPFWWTSSSWIVTCTHLSYQFVWFTASLLQWLYFHFLYNQVSSTWLICCAFIPLLIYVRHRMSYWKKREIPFQSFAILFNLIYSNDISLVHRYGNLFGSFNLTTPLLYVADYAVIKQILLVNSDNIANSKTFLFEEHFLPNSIFCSTSNYEQKWKNDKFILFSSFLSRKIRLLQPTMDYLINELSHHVDELCQKNLTKCDIKVNQFIRSWLIYSLLLLIFDIELPVSYHQHVENNAAWERLVQQCSQFIAAKLFISQANTFTSWPYLTSLVNFSILNPRNLKQIQSIVYDGLMFRLEHGLVGLNLNSNTPIKRSVKFIEQLSLSTDLREQSDVEPTETVVDNQNGVNKLGINSRVKLREVTFIDILLEQEYLLDQQNAQGAHRLTASKVVENLVAFFSVTLSTLSPTISALLYYLALYQTEQQQIKMEITDLVGSKSGITWESLRNLKRTEAFIKEVLRLHPPIERVERVVRHRCELDWCGSRVSLEPGTICRLLITPLHRDATYYPQPEQFNSHRFIESSNSKPFIPFGLGIHSCIGTKYIMFYLKHFIANLCMDFNVKLKPKWTDLIYPPSNPPSMRHILSATIEITPRNLSTD